MWKLMPTLLAFVLVVTQLAGQDYGNQKRKDGEPSLVTRMMEFNKKKDGKLTRDEVTDPRLLRLFDMADTNKDGVVTREELQALAAKLDGEYGQGGPGGKGPGDKGDKGDKGPKGKGKGGPGGFGGPPAPGQILPPFLQDQLNLTSDQKKQLNDLQREVDSKMDQILSEQQKQQLKQMRDMGPGGFGGKGPPGSGPPKGKPPMN